MIIIIIIIIIINSLFLEDDILSRNLSYARYCSLKKKNDKLRLFVAYRNIKRYIRFASLVLKNLTFLTKPSYSAQLTCSQAIK